jgi:NADH-quinone oxidoreductase subunit M
MFPFILLMLIVPFIALGLMFVFDKKYTKRIILGSTIINVIITFAIFITSVISGTINVSEQYPYITSLGITLGFSLNVISLILLMMSSVVLFATALAGNPEKDDTKLASALLAVFQIAAVGLFSASNLFIFFVFWDIGVITMFFMINTLGSANRRSASINFLIYEILASSLLLLGIMLLYLSVPVHSFDIQYITSAAATIPARTQAIIFILLFSAFMINMPIFPMHFWLPDAHTEASTQGSMLLSGVLTKFGGFGMIVLFSMLPIWSKYSMYIAILAGISVFYAVILLIHQTDLKRIIAYSTIVEMGIIMLGISAGNAFGTYGAAYAMLSHGFTIALMFLAVGVIKYIFGERSISALKGTVVNAASTTYVFILGVLAMIGFPLTAGFIADILLFLGALQAFGIFGLIPLFALVIMGAFLYFVISKSMLSTKEFSKSVDFVGREQKIGFVILLFFIFLFGLIPFTVLGLIKL